MKDNGFDYMNVIPLVDVMLVLLTIVLMTSTFVARGAIPLQLPKASYRQDKMCPKTVTITIDKNGSVYLESVPVSLAAVAAQLKPLSRETLIMVKVDRAITVQRCVDVFDLLAVNGFTKVALQTDRVK